MEPIIRFKHKDYRFEKTIVTNVASDYVPDWTLFHALRESIQNMVDEETQTGVVTRWQEEENGGVYFYDRGRGVKFEDILYLGVSGKREVEGVVGQHGEGELVSFVVSARLGIKKYMASQDWLAAGRIDNVDGYDVLVVDVYRAAKPRKGTAWYYAGTKGFWVIERFEKALGEFRQANKRARHTRIDLDEAPGQLFTRGMKVNVIEDLALSYDLNITPGRDRAGFTIEQAKDEIVRILNSEFKRKHIVELFRRKQYTWHEFKELNWEIDVDPEEVRLAGKDFIRKYANYKKEIVWADINATRGSTVADAEQLGFYVLKVSSPPQWIREGLRYAGSVVAEKKENYKDPPQKLLEATNLLKEILPQHYTKWILQVVWEFEDKDTSGLADWKGDIIVISRKQIKSGDFLKWLNTMIHEIAHIVTRAGDCSRQHADGMGVIGAILAQQMIVPGNAEKLQRAKELIEEYSY